MTTPHEYRIEHDTMGEVRVPASRALQRADPARRRELPDLGLGPRARPDRRPRPHQEGGRPRQRASSACSTPSIADAIAAAADEVIAGAHDDQFPIDVYQTGSRHLVEHEHERGARDPRHRALGSPGAPERPRQRLAVLERRVPHLGARRRHRRAHRRPHPRARPPRRRARGEGRAVGERRQVRPHPPHGCHPGDPRPGVRRLRPPDPPRHRARAARRSPASPRSRSAAPPSAPASTRPPASRSSSSSCSPPTPGCRSPRPRDHFEAQANRDGLVEASGALRTIAVEPHQDLQRPALDGLRPEHRPRRAAHPRPAARARRSCPARSTRSSPRPCSWSASRVIGNDATIAWARRLGLVRAQRADPGDGHGAARVDPAARERLARARRQDRRRPRGQPRAGRARSPSVAVDRDAAQPAHRLRGGREDRQALGRARASPCARPSSTSASSSAARSPLEQLDAALDVLEHDPPAG